MGLETREQIQNGIGGGGEDGNEDGVGDSGGEAKKRKKPNN